MMNITDVKMIIYTKMLVSSEKNPYNFSNKKIKFGDANKLHSYLLRSQKGLYVICKHQVRRWSGTELDSQVI